jgi:uncharacterized membrane protein (UPF0127 family)
VLQPSGEAAPAPHKKEKVAIAPQHFSPKRVITGNLRIRVRNKDRDTVLAEAADVADTSAKRRRGLLSHTSLEPGQGLWISPCESVHSFGMKFPIDLVYLDRKKKVRKVRRNMVPRRISACLTAHSVLELPLGAIDSSCTEPGDQLEFDRLDA